LRKKFVQSFFSWSKYIPFTPFPQAEFHQSIPTIFDCRFGISDLGLANFQFEIPHSATVRAVVPTAFRVGLLFSFIRKGFVDQHDRDIIFDLVDEATRLADQSISCPV
jgi:hypothetical protein